MARQRRRSRRKISFGVSRSGFVSLVNSTVIVHCGDFNGVEESVRVWCCNWLHKKRLKESVLLLQVNHGVKNSNRKRSFEVSTCCKFRIVDLDESDYKSRYHNRVSRCFGPHRPHVLCKILNPVPKDSDLLSFAFPRLSARTAFVVVERFLT